MKTESVKIKDLLNDPSNVRKHDERNIDAIKASLKRFGQQKPIVVDGKGIVVAGNGTLDAAKSLGWKEVQIVRTKLEGAEAIAYAVADNRTAELAVWDDDALAQTLAALHTDDSIDELVTGFTEQEIEDLIGKTADIEEDEVPELPEEAITQVGDLWLLGEHRLLCGDSTSQEDVARLMDGENCFDLITDPPYGTGISTQKGLGNSKMPMNLVGDCDTTLAKKAYAFWQKRGELQVWFGANYYSEILDGSKCWIVWDKDHHGMTFADAELAFVNNDSPVRVFRHAWSGSHRASEKGVVRGHPTQKPIALFAWILEKYSQEKLCVDPFLGSGSTLIACEQLGRKCYGMEIDPLYCDVIVKRWENLTGETARRESVAPIK